MQKLLSGIEKYPKLSHEFGYAQFDGSHQESRNALKFGFASIDLFLFTEICLLELPSLSPALTHPSSLSGSG